jgi:outer membrane lipoprotein carrier protein
MITLYGCVTLLVLTAAPPAGSTPAAPSAKPAAAQPAPGAKPAGAKPAPAARPGPEGPATTAEALLERIQRFYGDIKDYGADFTQVYRRVALSKTSESRGKLQIKKPGRMRWAYEKPVEKLWLVDGQKLWVTDPEQQQVYVDEDFETSDLTSAVGFLWGKGRLDTGFRTRLLEAGASDLPRELAALELVPRKGATYSRLVLGVDPRSGEVAESIVFETAGNTNRFRFRNARTDAGLPDSLFTFVPPAGWDVVRQ